MLGRFLEERPQDLYRVKLVDSGFLFTITKIFFEYLLSVIKREEVMKDFSAITRDEVNGEVVFLVELPFIHFPNHAHKTTDWKKLRVCAEQIMLLFRLLNLFPKDEDLSRLDSFSLSDGIQLMAISTSYSSERGFHASPLEVGFSQKAHELLSEAYTCDTHLEGCEKVACNTYFGLSTKTKREFEKERKSFLKYSGGFMGITAKVRGGGVPHFVVPGNCACLGANPDSFRYDRDLQSHNMDSSLQQMTMLASVFTFWNDVLQPLYEKK